MGWGEKGEDNRGYVVTAVVHALAEKSNRVGVGWGVFSWKICSDVVNLFREGHKFPIVDDVENEV